MLRRWMRYFRSRRMRRFHELFAITADTRVLDIGGTPEIWAYAPVRPKLTLLNTPRTREEQGAADWIAGDGRRLPFRDGAFDIVFSNSVIEHVGARQDQEAFAREVARVGRGYWVQTPARGFPIEPHLLTPFLHWLPPRWQRTIAPRFTVWALVSGASRDREAYYIRHYLEDIRLLTAREMATLFPDGRLTKERAVGMVKSLIAWRVIR